MNIRNILFIFLISIFFWSCSILDKGSIAPGYKEAWSSILYLIRDQENEEITVELIDKIPYASAILKIGKGRPGLIILESYSEDQEVWASADGVLLLLNKGKIIKTRGLTNNLKDILSSTGSHLNLNNPRKVSYYSFLDPSAENIPVTSNLTDLGLQTVELKNQTIELRLIEETIANDYLGWKETNSYWVDETGFVWKSLQFISPKLPVFKLEITKKPAR